MTTKKNKQPTAQTDKGSVPEKLPRAIAQGLDMGEAFSIHNNIKHLRQRAGLTLEALSLVTKGVDPDGVGISRVSLSRYETGSEPGLRELKILSWAFRKPLAVLVYGDPFDPMDGGQREPLDLLVEDIVGGIVTDILERRGIIPKGISTDSQNYQNLLDTAKKLAK